MVVAPTRHAPAAAFAMPVPADAAWAGELRAALAGSAGVGEGTDYRGEPVVVAWRYLPTFGWGLVLKQDRAEAFAPVRRSRLIGIGLAAVLLPLVIAAAWAVARTITRPLRAAAATARSVADGDLTVGRVTHAPDDEAGAVAVALGAMTAGLGELVGRIKDVSQTLGAMSAQLAATGRQQATAAGAFDGSAAEIAAAVRQIAATGDALAGRHGPGRHGGGRERRGGGRRPGRPGRTRPGDDAGSPTGPPGSAADWATSRTRPAGCRRSWPRSPTSPPRPTCCR